VKLFLKISNLCDHDTSTSRTDGRLCRSNTALCIASRGKNYGDDDYDDDDKLTLRGIKC